MEPDSQPVPAVVILKIPSTGMADRRLEGQVQNIRKKHDIQI